MIPQSTRHWVAGVFVAGVLALVGSSRDSDAAPPGQILRCTDTPATNPCILSAKESTQPNVPCLVAYKAANTPCDDKNACTYGETCDGAGQCGVWRAAPAAGKVDCSNDPKRVGNAACQTRECNGTSSCAVKNVADGTNCSVLTCCTAGACKASCGLGGIASQTCGKSGQPACYGVCQSNKAPVNGVCP